jgi:hypothetical protein
MSAQSTTTELLVMKFYNSPQKQIYLPVARFDLVDKDGALLASVPGQIALTISV